MGVAVHGRLFLEWDQLCSSGSNILYSCQLVGGEGTPSLVVIDTGLAEEHTTLLAVADSVSLVAVVTANLMRPGHLLQRLVQLQEVVD